jgi:predicted DNA-binding transcriptional regulator YafY
MNVDVLIKLIEVLPKSESVAVDSTQIRDDFYAIAPPTDPIKPASKNTNIRRYLNEMNDIGLLGVVYPPDTTSDLPRYERYYLKETKLLQYYMSSKVALNVIWSKTIMKQLGPVLDSEKVSETANAAPMSRKEKTVLDLVRMVPDGIAREYADIKPLVLRPIISALENGHRLLLKYHDRQGRVVLDDADGLGRAILGLVAKDGTLYLIGCKGFDDAPIHIPLHRIDFVEEIGIRTFFRPDFNLDEYIENQHQFAHVLTDQQSPIEMVLKVAPEALFHFRERPIAGGQEISEGVDADGRYTVAVTVPFTVMLPPFLWSHAGWVEVISPPALRQYVAKEILAAAEHYRNDANVGQKT